MTERLCILQHTYVPDSFLSVHQTPVHSDQERQLSCCNVTQIRFIQHSYLLFVNNTEPVKLHKMDQIRFTVMAWCEVEEGHWGKLGSIK